MAIIDRRRTTRRAHPRKDMGAFGELLQRAADAKGVTLPAVSREVLCPDAIAARSDVAQPKEENMLTQVSANAVNGSAKSISGANGGTESVRKRKALTHKQVGAIARVLSANGRVDGKVYTYNLDWSDDRVRSEIGDRDISTEQVAEKRREIFGLLQSELKAKPKSQADRITQLESDVASLAARIMSLETRRAA